METSSAVTTYGWGDREKDEHNFSPVPPSRADGTGQSHTGFFLKSHLIYFVSPVHFFSNQTKWNCHLTVCAFSVRCASDVEHQARYTVASWLKSREGHSDLKCMKPLASWDTFRHAPLKVKYSGKPYFLFQLSPTDFPRHKSSPWPTAAVAEREMKQNCVNVHDAEEIKWKVLTCVGS